MSKTQKDNVTKFNQDAKQNEGYLYSSNEQFSSRVANQRITDAIIDFMPDNVKSIIDIGCGDGSATFALKNVMPEKSFIGFDPASEAIASANKKYNSVQYFVGDILNEATFPDQKFDMAMLRGVIHHLTSASDGIKNSGKMSNRLLIIEPNGNNPILKWIEKNSQYHIDHEEQSFKTDTITKWCTESGFTVKRIEYIGFVPFFFPELPAKLIYFFQPLLERIYPVKKYFGAQIVVYCEKL